MATTINTYLDSVKIITADSLSALETAINTYIAGLEGKYATRVDVDVTSTAVKVSGNIKQTNMYIATVELLGTTTTD